MERVFSYGTLQDEETQLLLFGRRLRGHIDNLKGYRRVPIKLGDSEHHSASEQYWIAKRGSADDMIRGTVLEITPDELATADRYEPAEYVRAKVELESGAQAWIYVTA